MTTQEKIAVMQAYADGKKIQWSSSVVNPAWMDIDEPTWNWGTRTYRVKPEPVLPKTWEEFCETHPVKKGECFISHCHKDNIGQQTVVERERLSDMNFWLPNKQITKAMVALCQLIQLRDCYNDGWQPDWSDGTMKYVIYPYKNDIEWDYGTNESRILVFETKELRNEFYKNFKDLIEIAKPLL